MSPMMRTLLIALTLGSLASFSLAAPKTTSTAKSSSVAVPKSSTKTSATATSTQYSISQVSEFDNISGLPAVAAGPVGANSIYDKLKWNGFSLVETEAPNAPDVPGINPQSAPNCIAFGRGDIQTVMQGTPAITVNHADSSITSVTPISMYLGCTLGTETSLLGVPTSCTITVTGYGPPSSGSPKLATQSFNFVSNGGTTQDMQKFTFSSAFAKAYSVEFALANKNPLLTALSAGLVDNVSSKIFSNNPVTVN